MLENGRPQAITAFTEHKSTYSYPSAPRVQLPEHQYTNYNAPPPDHPITIVLLDMLNTVIEERAYARQQMIKFLSSLPPGQPVALFTLGDHLRMLQGFTQSSDALVSAAKSLIDNNESARLHTSEQELENAAAADAEFAAMSATLTKDPVNGMTMERALENEQSYQLDVRVRATSRRYGHWRSRSRVIRDAKI